MAGRVRVPKELEPFRRAAEAAGWRLEQTSGKGHIRWIPPDGQGQFIITASGHGRADFRSSRNAIASLRRAGVQPDQAGRPSGRKVQS